MFVEDYPMYLNFANLGIVISHELVHGFDHQGKVNSVFSNIKYYERLLAEKCNGVFLTGQRQKSITIKFACFVDLAEICITF